MKAIHVKDTKREKDGGTKKDRQRERILILATWFDKVRNVGDVNTNF